MVHSIGHQNLFPYAVIRERLRLAEPKRLLTLFGAANDPQWRHVAVGHNRVNRGRGISDVSRPDFFVLGIGKNPYRVAKPGARALDHAGRRDVSLVAAMKNNNVLTHVVGD